MAYLIFRLSEVVKMNEIEALHEQEIQQAKLYVALAMSRKNFSRNLNKDVIIQDILEVMNDDSIVLTYEEAIELFNREVLNY